MRSVMFAKYMVLLQEKDSSQRLAGLPSRGMTKLNDKGFFDLVMLMLICRQKHL